MGADKNYLFPVRISIVESNETYRESLGTLLSQVEGFTVVTGKGDMKQPDGGADPSFLIMLIDGGLGREKCRETVEKASKGNLLVLPLVLVMYPDELDLDYGIAGTILKNASKKEFETRIRKLAQVRM